MVSCSAGSSRSSQQMNPTLEVEPGTHSEEVTLQSISGGREPILG